MQKRWRAHGGHAKCKHGRLVQEKGLGGCWRMHSLLLQEVWSRQAEGASPLQKWGSAQARSACQMLTSCAHETLLCIQASSSIGSVVGAEGQLLEVFLM